MASKPGPLTRWPWHDMGNYKYALVAPWAAYSTYRFAAAKARGEEGDLLSLFVLPTLLFRLLYTQLWISVSRHQTARSKHRIVSKSLDFEQVDRERNWDDQIILTALLFYVVNWTAPIAQGLPWWNPRGLVVTALLHLGPVEFLYYWFHRALHHHFLYARYHSHHHASIVTEPVTSVIHPFAEEAVYFGLFAIPLLSMMATGTGSVAMSNSQFPVTGGGDARADCVYHSTPALVAPESYENLHACENWLPRRVMSAWRAAGIVHALERWPGHECGDAVTGVDKAWRAALAHGFRPYDAVAEPGQTPADAN